MKTLDQIRAERAWDIIRNLKDNGKDDKNELYASYVSSLPANIISLGIGQSLATLLAASQGKKDDPHYMLYKHLKDWLCRNDDMAPYPSANDLLDAIINNNREKYMLAQVEALAWLEWLKKFAVAYLKKPKLNEQGEK